MFVQAFWMILPPQLLNEIVLFPHIFQGHISFFPIPAKACPAYFSHSPSRCPLPLRMPSPLPLLSFPLASSLLPFVKQAQGPRPMEDSAISHVDCFVTQMYMLFY